MNCQFCYTGRMGLKRNLTAAEIVELYLQSGYSQGKLAPLQMLYSCMEDAMRLTNLVQGIPCKINFISFNPHPGSRFRPTPEEKMIEFRNALAEAGCIVLLRPSRGDDQMAACGQLGKPDEIQAPPNEMIQKSCEFNSWTDSLGAALICPIGASYFRNNTRPRFASDGLNNHYSYAFIPA